MEKRVVVVSILVIVLQVVMLSSVMGSMEGHHDMINSSIQIIEPSRHHYQSTFPLSIKLNENADELIIIDNGEGGIRSKVLCYGCDSYNSPYDLKEGYHFVQIQAWMGGEKIDENTFHVIIDSKKAKITKTLPRKGFSNGEFSVEFNEEFTKEVILRYGIYNDMKSISLDLENDCDESQRGKLCTKWVNLSEFDGMQIVYHFKIIDHSGNVAISKKYMLDVDNTKPEIKSYEYFTQGRKITFSFEIKEKNFKEIILEDNGGDSRQKNLCRKLNLYSCKKTMNFAEGDHDLKITVLDKAGNFEIINHLKFFCSDEGCVEE
ncbi:hypothetical protein COU57_05700 [Candidatus Pacearchaeota archaeon CG10_big_fil_rev_8_21_14_0_10_32_14]|nr:MAG: hypothetical protein COU57_05700 [Candidatus Pacearchaeota archaeon CG10_big_fil_rev_8_21_14_0_10_32_14]